MERHDAGPTDDLEGLSDHDLLAGGLGDQLAENFYAWRRLDRLDRFRARLERTYQARRAVEPHFTPTPLQECVLEASDLWGLDASRVQGDLRRVRMLKEHFPDVWTLCANGQLDTYKGGADRRHRPASTRPAPAARGPGDAD